MAERALAEKLGLLPSRPGVYLLRGRKGDVLYVGKARSLRDRVRQYFSGGDGRVQIRFLVNRVTDLEVLVTANEKEALILENNLIKQYKPPYNIRLKDDKSYWLVKVASQDPWPRLLLTRQVVRDGGKYLGPFDSGAAVQQTLEVIRKVFPLRTCSDTVFRNRARPCLEYQMKRCLGPCTLPVDREEYLRHLRGAVMLLEGKNAELLRQLEDRMRAAADEMRFEEAARLRDQIRAITRTTEKQQAVSPLGNDQDVFGLYREGGFIEVQVLFVRAGKLIGNRAYGFEDSELPDDEVLADLLTQFYQGERFVPDEVIVPVELEDARVREECLGERKGRRVSLVYPQRGDRLRLTRMAEDNARQSFIERQRTSEKREKMIEGLRRALHLQNSPKRIECFDISNIQGRFAVGSMVTFDEGEPDKSRYRRFRIRTATEPDDFAMMYEVLSRRYRRALEDKDFPDLLVVDGGKGQLGVALRVLSELGVGEVDAIGLAKERVKRDALSPEVARSPERVFLPGRKNPIILKPNSTALFLLQRVRDEAHRFAVTYHRELRRRERLLSSLATIPGVGDRRRRALLRHFGSLKRVRDASLEELRQVPGLPPAVAEAVHRCLAAPP